MPDMMKSVFSNGSLGSLVDGWLLVLRLSSCSFMIAAHGMRSLNKLFAVGEIQFDGPFGMNPLLSVLLVVFAEIFCAFLVLIGLWGRLALLPLIFTMFVAAFIAHYNDPFQKRELALLFILIFISLYVFGSGKYSVDHYLSTREKSFKLQ